MEQTPLVSFFCSNKSKFSQQTTCESTVEAALKHIEAEKRISLYWDEWKRPSFSAASHAGPDDIRIVRESCCESNPITCTHFDGSDNRFQPDTGL
jgi:hypothetical protein